MTPYSLGKIAEAALKEHETGDTQVAIFRMLHALLRHEADVEANRNIARSNYQQALSAGNTQS